MCLLMPVAVSDYVFSTVDDHIQHKRDGKKTKALWVVDWKPLEETGSVNQTVALLDFIFRGTIFTSSQQLMILCCTKQKRWQWRQKTVASTRTQTPSGWSARSVDPSSQVRMRLWHMQKKQATASLRRFTVIDVNVILVYLCVCSLFYL